MQPESWSGVVLRAVTDAVSPAEMAVSEKEMKKHLKDASRRYARIWDNPGIVMSL